MANTLLALPEEVLIDHVLLSLEWTWVMSFSLTCKTLYHIVNTSTALSYKRELAFAQMVDNPLSDEDTMTRLRLLRESQTRWLHVEPKWTSPVPIRLPGGVSGLNDIDAGFYFQSVLGTPARITAARSLPSTPQNIPWASATVLGGTLLNFAVAITEYDLVMYLVSDFDQGGARHIKLYLQRWSSADQHPLAAHPFIVLDTPNLPSFGLIGVSEIKLWDDTIYTTVEYPMNHKAVLQAFNWKTGQSSEAIFVRHPSVAVLAPGIIVQPDGHALDLYHLPPFPDTHDPSAARVEFVKLRSLSMPPMGVSLRWYFYFRSHGGCTSHIPAGPDDISKQRPFHPDPRRTILLLLMNVLLQPGDAWLLYGFAFRKESLCALAQEPLSSWAGGGTPKEALAIDPLPWALWGPECCRIFPMFPRSNPFCLPVSGTRWATMEPFPEGAGSYEALFQMNHLPKNVLRVLDFNPALVSRARGLVDQGGEIVTGYESECGARRRNRVRLVDIPSVIEGSNTDPHSAFSESVTSRLPYVETTYIPSNSSTDTDAEANRGPSDDAQDTQAEEEDISTSWTSAMMDGEFLTFSTSVADPYLPDQIEVMYLG